MEFGIIQIIKNCGYFILTNYWTILQIIIATLILISCFKFKKMLLFSIFISEFIFLFCLFYFEKKCNTIPSNVRTLVIYPLFILYTFMYLYFLKLIYRNFLLKKKIPKGDNDDIPYFEKNIIITGKTGTYKTRKVLSRYNNYFYLDISITSRPESLKIYSQGSSVINHIVYRIIIYIYNGIILDDFQFITTDMLGMFEWQNFKNSHVIIISTQSLIDISKLHDKLFNNKLDKFINHIVHTNNLVTEEMRNNNIIEIKFLQHLLEFHLSIIEDSRLVDNMRSQINDNYVNSIFIRGHYIGKEYTNNDTYDKNIKLMEELTINYPDFKGEYFINHIDYLLVKYGRYGIIKTYELNKSYFIDNDLLLHEKYLIEDLYRLSNYDDKILMNEDGEKRNRFFKKVSEMIDCS